MSSIYVGHRGASYLAPENTLSSQKLAWELGAAGSECDILMTKDKQVIMFHDPNGLRLLHQDIDIAKTNYNELKDYPIYPVKDSNLSIYQGQKISLLADVLDILPPDKLFVIEIKTGNEIVAPLQKVIDQHWKQGKIAFIAFDLTTILEMKALYPTVPCHFLAASRHSLQQNFKAVINSSLDGINLDYKIIDKKLVEKYKTYGKSVWCWTVNTVRSAIKMEAAGVELITTDRPKWLVEQVAKKKKSL
jgi:glycerophosphoryl diester phosphodiesterase